MTEPIDEGAAVFVISVAATLADQLRGLVAFATRYFIRASGFSVGCSRRRAWGRGTTRRSCMPRISRAERSRRMKIAGMFMMP